jgi:tryptophan synthase alpha chain
MTRYRDMFSNRSRRGECALGAFLMLGDPSLDECAEFIMALIDGGADMLELGIPFSDPIADGPVIQAAANRALAAGVRPADALALVSRIRARSTRIPIGLLTYANIAFARGLDAFYKAAADAGADSVLLADVPVFEAEPFVRAARAANIAPTLIAAPNTPDSRLDKIAQWGGGYTYCVTRAGVTGAVESLDFDHSRLIAALDERAAPPPVFGFGVSTAAHVAAAFATGAAGVISGSAIVARMRDGPAAVSAFVRELKEATRRGR